MAIVKSFSLKMYVNTYTRNHAHAGLKWKLMAIYSSNVWNVNWVSYNYLRIGENLVLVLLNFILNRQIIHQFMV